MINLKKQQLYNKVKKSLLFTKNTTRPSELFVVPRKQIPSDSISLEFKNVHEDRKDESSCNVSGSEFGYSEIQVESPINVKQDSFEAQRISVALPKRSIFHN